MRLKIYLRHTGQPLNKIEKALERDYFLTAEMTRDFGLLDTLIEKPHPTGRQGGPRPWATAIILSDDDPQQRSI